MPKLRFVLPEKHYNIVMHSAQNKVVNAGRRFGKTELLLFAIYKHLHNRYYSRLDGHEMRLSIGYYAPTYSQAEEIFWDRLCERFKPIQAKKPDNDKLVFFFKPMIGRQYASRIRLFGTDMKPDRLRGNYKTLAITDERAFFKPNVFNAAISPQLGDANGEQIHVSTPNGHEEFYEEYQYYKAKETEGDSRYKVWTYKSVDGGYIDETFVNNERDRMDELMWRQEYQAEFILSSSAIYYNFNPDIHITEFDYQPDLTIHWGWDFNIVPSVHSVLCHQYNNRLYAFDEICVGDTPTTVVRFMEKYPPVQGQRIILYGDYNGTFATSGFSDYAIIENMLQAHGYNVVRKVQVNPFERDRTNNINYLLLDANKNVRLLIDPRCKKLIKDLKLLKNKNGKIDKTSDPYLSHASDALGYMAYMLFPPKFPTRTSIIKQATIQYDNKGWWR
jgi:hypothetical protein